MQSRSRSPRSFAAADEESRFTEPVWNDAATAPAERFGASSRTGRLARGLAADLVVLDGDPERDIRALANVRYTLRAGRVVYGKGPQAARP